MPLDSTPTIVPAVTATHDTAGLRPVTPSTCSMLGLDDSNARIDNRKFLLLLRYSVATRFVIASATAQGQPQLRLEAAAGSPKPRAQAARRLQGPRYHKRPDREGRVLQVRGHQPLGEGLPPIPAGIWRRRRRRRRN